MPEVSSASTPQSGAPPEATRAARFEYKVAELSVVDEGTLERALNEWTRRGWRFDGLQLAMRESSRRPSMAFLLFTRALTRDGWTAAAEGLPTEPRAVEPSELHAGDVRGEGLGEPLGGASGGIFAVERTEPVRLEPLGPRDEGAPFAFRSPREALRHLERIAHAADAEGPAVAAVRAGDPAWERLRRLGGSARGKGDGEGER